MWRAFIVFVYFLTCDAQVQILTCLSTHAGGGFPAAPTAASTTAATTMSTTAATNPAPTEALQNELTTLRQQFRNLQTTVNGLSSIRSDLSTLRQGLQMSGNNLANLKAALERGYIEMGNGWIAPFNGYQYKVTTSRLTWTASRSLCRRWGGDLDVHGLRYPHVKKIIYQVFGKHHYWIGLTDNGSEGTWRWVNGVEARKDDVDIWYKGLPMYSQPNGGTRENYGMANSAFINLAAHDEKASRIDLAICEKAV